MLTYDERRPSRAQWQSRDVPVDERGGVFDDVVFTRWTGEHWRHEHFHRRPRASVAGVLIYDFIDAHDTTDFDGLSD